MSYGTRIRAEVLGIYVPRTAALPVGTGLSEDLFSVTGKVMITGFYGYFTAAMPAESIDFDLAFDPDDGGSDVVLATLLAVDSKPIGNFLTLNSTAGGALVSELDVAYGIALAKPIVTWDGDIKLNVAGGGAIGTAVRVEWGLTYIPMSADGAVTAV